MICCQAPPLHPPATNTTPPRQRPLLRHTAITTDLHVPDEVATPRPAYLMQLPAAVATEAIRSRFESQTRGLHVGPTRGICLSATTNAFPGPLPWLACADEPSPLPSLAPQPAPSAKEAANHRNVTDTAQHVSFFPFLGPRQAPPVPVGSPPLKSHYRPTPHRRERGAAHPRIHRGHSPHRLWRLGLLPLPQGGW
jgi:hypothetical protein